ESRFLGSIDGGHAGGGHRRRVVGNEDFPRRVNEQELASDKRPPSKKRFATKASLPRRRKISFRDAGQARQAAKRAPWRVETSRPASSRRHFGFQGLNAFQRLSFHRSPGSHGPAARLRVL